MEDTTNEVVHTLEYQLLHACHYEETMMAESFLKMPSGPNFDHVQWNFPRLVMDLKDPDDLHCLTLMKTCAHKNILQLKTVNVEGAHLVVWTEPYTGRLIDLLRKMKSNLGNPICPPPWVVPSDVLQIIVDQVLDGMGQLRLDGKYHGNFSLENTYYHMESGKPIVKLANFRVKKEAKLRQCQLEDVWDIARALDEICVIAEECTRTGRVPLDCYLVADLSKKLKEVSLGDLVTVMKDIKKHSFFWGSYQRKRFFVCDLPFALRSSDFKKDVEASSTLCTIPWDTDPYSGLLQDMNQYRALHKKHAYDGSKKTGFCSFCSGLYSHEFELPVVRRVCVDKVLQQRHRKACFEMVGMMPDRETKYMLSKKEAA
ncbi:unnamed protein product [Triticum turgidum subsp. durum]|uniref:Uncharacterized protein n=1 Tax=Triticum turgidum subsp. durum TaxID=4567 RepID=A0A9R0V387_TRITD|nr:unnamed protein product [Triticum turgidum subsp. durum]